MIQTAFDDPLSGSSGIAAPSTVDGSRLTPGGATGGAGSLGGPVVQQPIDYTLSFDPLEVENEKVGIPSSSPLEPSPVLAGQSVKATVPTERPAGDAAAEVARGFFAWLDGPPLALFGYMVPRREAALAAAVLAGLFLLRRR